MTVFGQFVCQMYFKHVSRGCKKRQEKKRKEDNKRKRKKQNDKRPRPKREFNIVRAVLHSCDVFCQVFQFGTHIALYVKCSKIRLYISLRGHFNQLCEEPALR